MEKVLAQEVVNRSHYHFCGLQDELYESGRRIVKRCALIQSGKTSDITVADNWLGIWTHVVNTSKADAIPVVRHKCICRLAAKSFICQTL